MLMEGECCCVFVFVVVVVYDVDHVVSALFTN